jgi:hypothetical protein
MGMEWRGIGGGEVWQASDASSGSLRGKQVSSSCACRSVQSCAAKAQLCSRERRRAGGEGAEVAEAEEEEDEELSRGRRRSRR